ncbi:hypothetical protein [Methanoregula sp.]|jgi:hypothetical protein|uniref:hypothetical protein n=1 Tax=Methanoregula sp. TaxID=2052170 RepID=UPI003C17FF1D
MTRTNARGSAKGQQRYGKSDGIEKPVSPVKIPRRVVAGLPLLYRALCEVMVRDGLVQLVSEDTLSDEKEQ